MRGEENRKRWMRRYWAYRREKGLAAEVSFSLRPLDTALVMCDPLDTHVWSTGYTCMIHWVSVSLR